MRCGAVRCGRPARACAAAGGEGVTPLRGEGVPHDEERGYTTMRASETCAVHVWGEARCGAVGCGTVWGREVR